MGIVWENTTPSTEFPMTFVLGLARCSSALCLFILFVKLSNMNKSLHFYLGLFFFQVEIVYQ